MTSRSPKETRAAGRQLAGRVRPGDVLLLSGPLGSGKTTFVQGIAEGLGAETPATSPSFVIVNEYPLRGLGNEVQTHAPKPTVLRHIDLYRLPADAAQQALQTGLTDPAVDLDRLGLPELLRDPAAVTVIEWADRMPVVVSAAAGRRVRVRLGHGRSESERTIDIAEDR